MKPSYLPLNTWLLALALAFAPCLASAGIIDIDKAEGDIVVDLLDAESRLHVDAMQAMLTTYRPDIVRNGQRRLFKFVSGRMHAATVARIEYTYEKDGLTHTRTYHARSGRSMTVIADLAQNKTGGSASSATESGDTDATATSLDLADDAERDASDRLFYPPDTPTNVRVAALPNREGRIEAVDIGDGKSHGTDAEVKIVRRIEADIEDGAVARGGKLIGYVSKTVCESCRNAFDILGTRYDVQGTVFQLIEPASSTAGGRSIAPDLRTALGRSQKASLDLKTRRTVYANSQIKQGNLRSAAREWNDLRAIERAETSAGVDLANVCE